MTHKKAGDGTATAGTYHHILQEMQDQALSPDARADQGMPAVQNVRIYRSRMGDRIALDQSDRSFRRLS